VAAGAAADADIVHVVRSGNSRQVTLGPLAGAVNEEGTWTPTIDFVTTGDLSVTYLVQNGSYCRIGNCVILNGYVQTSAFTHTTASSSLEIGGLPYAAANVANQFGVGKSSFRGITKANFTDVISRITANTQIMNLQISGSGQASTLVTAADMPSGGTVQFIFNLTYFV